MWTCLSAGHWTCLLTLTGVMLVSASQDTFQQLGCCGRLSSWIKGQVEYDCYIQEPWKGCPVAAYWVKPVGKDWRCIKKDSRWIEKMIQEDKIKCRPQFFEPHRRSEVLARMMQRD